MKLKIDHNIKKSIFSHDIYFENKVMLLNTLIKKPYFLSQQKYEKYMKGFLSDEDFIALKTNKYFVDKNSDADTLKRINDYFKLQKGILNTVYINITSKCNLICDYCLVSKYRKNRNLSKRDFLFFKKN